VYHCLWVKVTPSVFLLLLTSLRLPLYNEGMSVTTLELATILSVPEAAAHLGLHPHSVRLAIRDGRLKARRVGNRYWIEREALVQWQARRALSFRGKSDTDI
jgi:excisionase family DNA binding protein